MIYAVAEFRASSTEMNKSRRNDFWSSNTENMNSFEKDTFGRSVLK